MQEYYSESKNSLEYMVKLCLQKIKWINLFFSIFKCYKIISNRKAKLNVYIEENSYTSVLNHWEKSNEDKSQ